MTAAVENFGAHRAPLQLRLPGSARVSRVGETAPVSPTFKECFGETPKPAPETGALPGVVAAAVTGGRIEQGICR